MKLRPAALLAFGLFTACGGDDDPTTSWQPLDGPPAHVVGHAFIFGPNPSALTIEGAIVAVAEDPSVSTTVNADGSFELDVPSGGFSSFSLTKSGFIPSQSAAIEITAAGIQRLGFQTPALEAVDQLATFARVTLDPTKCQISTTVSRAGTEPYGGDSLGVAGAVSTISPAADADGPIYFASNGSTTPPTIFPDRALAETSIDGGVIFANVSPGEYTITASKAGTAFSPATIRCRPGVLVNAAPPNGIQEI